MTMQEELDQARSDLAAAQRVVEAAKAWCDEYAAKIDKRGGDVRGCGTWIHFRDALYAILRGEKP